MAASHPVFADRSNSGEDGSRRPLADVGRMRETPGMRATISTTSKAILVVSAVPLTALAALLFRIFKLKENLSATDVANSLRAFVEGTGEQWDWDDFTSVAIVNPQLDDIRRRAAAVTAPYAEESFAIFRELLVEAEALEAQEI